MTNPIVDRYDRRAAVYERCWAPVLHPGGALLLDRIDRALPGLAAGSPFAVLDVGCGTGNELIEAARRWPAAAVSGLDASAGMLAVAGRAADALAAAERARVTLVRADAAAQPFASGSFDLVMSSFVVQLVPDRAAVLREMRRVLRPDGLLAIAGWLEDRAGQRFEPEEAFEAALAELGIERPPRAGESRAGDFASARSAANELRRAAFERVAARADALDFGWTRDSFLAYKRSYREADLFDGLAPEQSARLEADVMARLGRLSPDAFRFRPPVVTLLARRSAGTTRR